MTPANELEAAAEQLRAATFRGAMTATPAAAALLRTREPLADWLDAASAHVRAGYVCCDSGAHRCYESGTPQALAVARAINGGQQ
ncbi:hypothetical protein ACWGDE_01600 [Streptomyces sp. NPDC054956]